jgi:cytidylate kinase
VENFARRAKVSIQEAAAQIERIEQERRDFFRRFFHAEAEDSTRFDLLINVERFSAQEATELICLAMKARLEV